MGRDGQVDLHGVGLGAGRVGEFADRFGDHLDVQVEADRRDMSGLFGPSRLPGAADFEVAHGDLEAGTEIGELADRLQPFVGLFGELVVARVQQVCVGALAAPADPSPQLVQLREAEPIGAVDDERVDGRHVEPAFDDRRADQHVVLAFPELLHDPFESALVHLAVSDGDTRFGYEFAYVGGDMFDVLHPVVHVERLSFAQQLSPNRFGHGALVMFTDVGEDRLAILGRCVDERQVADTGE